MKKSSVFIIMFALALFIMSSIVFSDDSVSSGADGNNYYMLLGDADNNNIVDASDALRILKIIAHIENMGNDFSIRKNDYDNNYKIDAKDALAVLKIAADLVDGRVIYDPQNFFGRINYINGYPENDFISGSLTSGILYTLDEGECVKKLSCLGIEKYENGIKSDDNIAKAYIEDVDFDKIYWELRWLIEDAKNNNQLEIVSEDINNSWPEILAASEFNGFEYYTSVNAKQKSNSTQIHVIINEANEMLFYVDMRVDLYDVEEASKVYKYTGEIPENLTYESIKKYYYYLQSEKNK